MAPEAKIDKQYIKAGDIWLKLKRWEGRKAESGRAILEKTGSWETAAGRETAPTR